MDENDWEHKVPPRGGQLDNIQDFEGRWSHNYNTRGIGRVPAGQRRKWVRAGLLVKLAD